MLPAPAAHLDVIHDRARAAALLDPLRLRILEQLGEPQSASGLARQLSLPRQKVNYHLRELEKGGFAELVEERRKGNCIERLFKAKARYYVIDPAVLGALAANPEQIQDQFSSAYLVAVAARAIREVAGLRERAEKAGKRLATFTLETEVRFASAEARAAFAQELAGEVARLAAKYHNESASGGRSFQFFVGGYPKTTREKDEGAQQKEEKK